MEVLLANWLEILNFSNSLVENPICYAAFSELHDDHIYGIDHQVDAPGPLA